VNEGTHEAAREIVIRKPFTILLLILSTLAIIWVTVWMAGKSYENFDPIPFDDIRYLAKRLGERPISTHILAVIIVPMIGNVLLFVPWGFFTFIALYTVDRPTLQTYVLTTLLGLSLTLGIEAWQYFLPSRVADVNDVIWNTTGAVLGALLGHARLRLRFEFE
jgi:glycopeptide antibiotics resistance protein